MEPSNLLTEWARLLMSTLADAGVEDVVVSPGSRSTPFVVAAVRERRLRCHSVIDERSAAFFALGQARVTGKPAVLLCTSGTAAGHYLPAIMEAATSHVPLVVVTADRPPELQECAAPQTTDQLKLFGSYTRRFFDLGMPSAEDAALRSVRRMAAQAVLEATWPLPGAVHVNARARKPLEPHVDDSPAGEKLRASAARMRERGAPRVAVPDAVPSASGIAALAEMCARARRGLIVAGPAPLAQAKARATLTELSRALHFPIAAEATSQLRWGREIGAACSGTDRATPFDAVDAVMRSRTFRERMAPDVVLQIGAPPVSTGWQQLAGDWDGELAVVASHGWNDPESNASLFLFGDPERATTALLEAVRRQPPPPVDAAWLDRVADAGAAAWRAVDAELASTTILGEGHVARAVVDAAPAGSVLVLGNSLAVRLVDTWCPSGAKDLRVLCQRGVSGIDGLIAGAAGAATHAASAVTLLLGDVSMLHDLTALGLLRDRAETVVIVVIQNHGGRIFEQLPLAQTQGIEKEVLDLTLTPHQTDMHHAGPLFGVRWQTVTAHADLGKALSDAYATAACTVVEAVVEPSGAITAHRKIWRAVDEHVRAALAAPAAGGTSP